MGTDPALAGGIFEHLSLKPTQVLFQSGSIFPLIRAVGVWVLSFTLHCGKAAAGQDVDHFPLAIARRHKKGLQSPTCSQLWPLLVSPLLCAKLCRPDKRAVGHAGHFQQFLS